MPHQMQWFAFLLQMQGISKYIALHKSYVLSSFYECLYCNPAKYKVQLYKNGSDVLVM